MGETTLDEVKVADSGQATKKGFLDKVFDKSTKVGPKTAKKTAEKGAKT